MKYAINRIQYIEGPREAEFQIWRIIMQVGASYMRKSESTHSLHFTYVPLEVPSYSCVYSQAADSMIFSYIYIHVLDL